MDEVEAAHVWGSEAGMQDTKQMSVLDAIVTRRSIPQFQPTPVPREIIKRLLDAAVWVPNHRLTEPWQFFVLGRRASGDLLRSGGTSGRRRCPTRRRPRSSRR